MAALAPARGARQDPTGSREAAARVELERVGQLRRRLAGLHGREREALRERVVRAYRELRARFGEQHGPAAEASFRAGELLRAAGAAEAARAEFEQAWEHGTRSAWRARAGLELGHLARRAELHEEALGRYRAVIADSASAPGRRDEAALWAARCCIALEREREARDLLERVARQADDPCDRVVAHDELALLWIAAGDLEAAAGELQRGRVAVRERAIERTPLGARVRSALRRMRAVERLRAAVAARREGVVIER